MAWFRTLSGAGGSAARVFIPEISGVIGNTTVTIQNGRYIYGFGTANGNKAFYPTKTDGAFPTYDLTKSFHYHLKLKHRESNVSGYQFSNPLVLYTSTVSTGNMFVLTWTDYNNVETNLRIPKTDLPLNVGAWYTVDVEYNATQGTVTLTASDGTTTQTVTESVNRSRALGNIGIGNPDGYNTKLVFDLADCYWEEDGILLWGNKDAEVDMHTWSTTEHVVGTWIDGKAVYEKTIDCGYLPNNSAKVVAHGISNIGKIIEWDGSVITDAGAHAPIPFVHTDGLQYTVSVVATSSEITLTTKADRTTWYAYITLRYTKSTS